MARLPAVRSSRHDPHDFPHLLVQQKGPIIEARYYGNGYGGAEVRVDGVTPVEATAKQAQMLTSFYGLRRP